MGSRPGGMVTGAGAGMGAGSGIGAGAGTGAVCTGAGAGAGAAAGATLPGIATAGMGAVAMGAQEKHALVDTTLNTVGETIIILLIMTDIQLITFFPQLNMD